MSWSVIAATPVVTGRDQKTVFTPVVMSENERLIDRGRDDRAGFRHVRGRGQAGLADGSPAHVRDVVGQYAAIGVSQIIMMAQAPWKREIYQRVNDEVVSAFA